MSIWFSKAARRNRKFSKSSTGSPRTVTFRLVHVAQNRDRRRGADVQFLGQLPNPRKKFVVHKFWPPAVFYLFFDFRWCRRRARRHWYFWCQRRRRCWFNVIDAANKLRRALCERAWRIFGMNKTFLNTGVFRDWCRWRDPDRNKRFLQIHYAIIVHQLPIKNCFITDERQ